MKKIKALVKRVNQEPTIEEIFDYYKNYQELVGGYMEIARMPFNEDIICVLNEEGKIYGLASNLMVNEYHDIFVGNLVFVGDNGEDFRSLTEDEIKQVKDYITLNAI